MRPDRAKWSGNKWGRLNHKRSWQLQNFPSHKILKINAVRERLRSCCNRSGCVCQRAFLVWMLSIFPRWPRADTGIQQECDSTIWPKRNETSHVRNAGNLVSWKQSYQRPSEVFVVLQMQRAASLQTNKCYWSRIIHSEECNRSWNPRC